MIRYARYLVAVVAPVLFLSGCVSKIFEKPVDRESYNLFSGSCKLPPAPTDEAFDTEIQPFVIYQYTTAYPPLPPWAGNEGKVRLRVLVDCNGRVADAVVGISSGIPVLDSTALEGIYFCRFAPQVINNRPIASWIRVRYDFVPPGSPIPLGDF